MRLRPINQQPYVVNLPRRETFIHEKVSFFTKKSLSDLSVIAVLSHLFVFDRLNKHLFLNNRKL